MKKLGWIGASVAVLALSNCSPKTENPETPAATPSVKTAGGHESLAPFITLLDTPFTQTGTTEADLSALVAALPDYVELKWDSKSLNVDTGATVFEGLSLSLGGDTPFGFRFEDASVWGLETDLLTARLGGQRLDEAGPLFTRLDGTEVSYFGVAEAMNQALADFLDLIDKDLPPEIEVAFDEFDFTSERVIMTGLELRPWELVKAPASLVESIDAESQDFVLSGIHFGQQIIAVMRSMAYDQAITTNTVGTFSMRQPGANVNMQTRIGLSAYSGVSGFDFDTVIVQDGYTKQVSEYVKIEGEDFEDISVTGFPAGLTLAQETSYALSTIEGFQLDKLMGFLARSEVPGMEERDLMSFGRWGIRDYVGKLNDKTILTMVSGQFAVDQFEWVIPSHLSYDLNQVTVNTGELTDFIKVFVELAAANEGFPADDEEANAEFDLIMEGLDKAIDLLPEHGLATITFDTDMSVNWDADNSLTEIAVSTQADGFGEGSFNLSIDLPVYEQLQAAMEADDKEAAFQTAFEEAFAFNGVRLFEHDGGGFDKILGFAQAIGKEYPDQGWGVMLANMDPPQMRSYLATITRMGKAAASEELPQAEAWIESMASYIEEGGSIELKSAPPSPITKALMESYDDEPDADELVEIFGLSVTHTK